MHPHADQNHRDAGNHEYGRDKEDHQVAVRLGERPAADGVIGRQHYEYDHAHGGDTRSGVADPIPEERHRSGTGARLWRDSGALLRRHAARQQLVPFGEPPGLRDRRDLVPQFTGRHELPTGENTVQQAVFFLDRDKHRKINVEDDEREEHEHQKVVNQAKIPGVDEQRQPADELVEHRVAQHLAE